MLRAALEDTVRRQMAADVPVMAYLSGGIDSSSLVAGAHRIDPAVRAYSCLFDLAGVGDDKIVDEREFSRAVAAHLDIAHIELELAPTAMMGSLHRTIDALEEPAPDEDPLIVDVGPSAGEVAEQIIRRLSQERQEARDARRDHP